MEESLAREHESFSHKFLSKMRSLDYLLLLPYVALCLIGVIMVYSASAAIRMQTGGSPVGYLVKQAIFVAIGWVICNLLTLINLDVWRGSRFIKTSSVIMLAALIIVKFAGQTVNGASGWFHFAGLSIQPAEFCKLFFILYWANIIDNRSRRQQLVTIKTSWQPMVFTALLLFLIICQPDVGGTAINAAIVVSMIMASGYDWRWTTGILGVFFVSVAFLLPTFARIIAEGHVKNYQVARFLAYINPFGTQNGAGSQLVNSYYAISNGGITGSGLGNSIQKLGYLPEPNTDFIMSVTSEELGAIGVSIILLLLLIVILRMIYLGCRIKNIYEQTICYGVGTFFAVEAAINIGGVTGLLPITGVTFPFISYGGSSMIVLSAALGLVMNISIRRKRTRQQGRR